ncbi:hypothetical protein [Cytobacillus sp. NCCP-133]|uniref:hypothetical protein n=1 Tax=Cytobacillus sp. NCCP-133 TaxID=766848 RepID=UPI002231B2F5|nr:hypothetical protein [Cytobacillus sp. NCCP-133]GLB60415.1 hypothetical protein NCCP133_25470 [Cytobacillus sp. NCCP-133]
MKIMAKLLLIAGLIAGVLAGCGTGQNTNDDAAHGDETAQTEEEATEGQDGKEQADEGDAANGETSQEGDTMIRILEQNLSYSVNGEIKKDTAFLKHSDNQNYSMYVLPGYELTAEEPHKDILFYTENDQVFMRIELLPEDADWNMIEENTKSQLAAVSKDVQTGEAPADEFFQDATVMRAEQNSEKVTAYLIKKEDLALKLTLFNKANDDHEEAFLQMAKTIMKEEPQK